MTFSAPRSRLVYSRFNEASFYAVLGPSKKISEESLQSDFRVWTGTVF